MKPEVAVARDLQWAIESPALGASLPPRTEEWARARLPVIGAHDEIIEHRRAPIGRYFERLVSLWMGCQEDVDHLETNIRIQGSTRTLGELDLIFKSRGRAYHWELALKLYLGVGDRREACNWYGPLGRDRLDFKLEKLRTRQLRLLESPEAMVILAKLGIDSIESHCFIKGYLFHPFGAWQEGRRVAPFACNPQHGHGWWAHLSDLLSVSQRHASWVLLPKPDWLAPALRSEAMSGGELLECLTLYYRSQVRPLLVAALDERGRERERGFVVPDNWPPEPR